MPTPMRQNNICLMLGAWVVWAGSLYAQSAVGVSTSPTSNTPAVSLPSIGAAVAGSTNTASIVLTGTVIQDPMAPNRPSEPIWLQVDADGKTQMKITTATAMIGETRAAAGHMESCTSTSDTANKPAITAANCWSPASWILPTVALAQSAVATKLASSLSTGTQNDRAALQLALHINTAGHSTRGTDYINTVTARTVYLDPQTLLPFSMTYTEFAGNNTFKTTPIEVDYSDYQPFSGVMVPLHIVKKNKGLPVLDISISQVTVSN
jgi:hypothetical protein